ncbi:acyltransferase [Brevibacillus fluminis]|uniref:Acyltransferase n=1 Tax=Brevibacillus fluminis TaxID=511487 RepID=A0A3M8D314_9BACL|nr:carbon-nitrogen hydrolase family protein [Brevibacillus fluminis]RNB81981.1 acyltransferase [Brevibacillus fluminis]
MAKTTIGSVQYEIGPLKTKAAFWDQVNAHVRTAKENGVNLLMFPEYLTGHLLALEPEMSTPDACAYLDRHTDEYMTTFTEISRQTGMTILGGTHIHKENDGYLNTAFLFFPDGRIERQTKIHPTPEERRTWFLTAGDSYSVYDTEHGKLAIQICYDIEFPEGSRIVADMGAEIILCPSYTDTAAGYWRVRHCSQARAIENQLFVVLGGIVGELPHVPQIDAGYCQAGFFAPSDHPFPASGTLAVGETNKNSVIIHTLDLELIQENRKNGGVSPYFDRKTALYDRYRTTSKA